jgi:outer membrane protein assembly factor BamB
MEVSDRAVLVDGVGSRHIWVRNGDGSGEPPWRKIELPSPLAARPLAWGGGILVPGEDGRIYLIDPSDARSLAEPFVPVFDRDRRQEWLAPARIDEENVAVADASGRLRRIALRKEPVPRLVSEAEVLLDERPTTPPVATSQAVVIVTADGRVRSLAARDLSPAGSWTLAAPLSGLPQVVANACFVADTSGGILALGADGHKLWSASLAAEASGPPAVLGESAWFLTRGGHLQSVSRADGAIQSRQDLKILPAGGPIALKGPDGLVLPVARGVLSLASPATVAKESNSP